MGSRVEAHLDRAPPSGSGSGTQNMAKIADFRLFPRSAFFTARTKAVTEPEVVSFDRGHFNLVSSVQALFYQNASFSRYSTSKFQKCRKSRFSRSAHGMPQNSCRGRFGDSGPLSFERAHLKVLITQRNRQPIVPRSRATDPGSSDTAADSAPTPT